MPIPPYAGDDVNPPVKGNSGIGVRELTALVCLHGLLQNPKYFAIPEDAIPEAFDLADQFYTQIFQ